MPDDGTSGSPDDDSSKASGNEKKALADGLRYAQVGLVLPMAVVAGWFFGTLLDRRLGTHWLYLAGLGLGVVAGFYDLIRTMVKMSKGVK